MENLNTLSGSEFYVEVKNCENSDSKCFFHAAGHYANDDKKLKQVKLTNNIMHTRTLETDILSLSIETHSHLATNNHTG